MTVLKTFPTLFDLAKTGKIKEWNISVVEEDDKVLIRKYHGQQGNKFQTQDREIRSGKNVGKANETTIVEQAISEAESAWKLKMKGGYGTDVSSVADCSSEDLVLRPMLVAKFQDREKKGKVIYPLYVQPKLDGMRCICRKIGDRLTFLSRGGDEIATMDHLKPQILKRFPQDAIIDGELYIHGKPFQNLMEYIKKSHEENGFVQYWIYDFVDPEDVSETFSERWKKLFKSLATNTTHLIRTPSVLVKSAYDVDTLHIHMIAQGFEGVILRHPHGVYEFGRRSYDVMKLKDFDDAEFLITGGTSAEGIEEGCVIFECETNEGVTFTVRPRGTHSQRKEWLDNLPELVGKYLTVRYQGFYADGSPRFPVGLRIRETMDLPIRKD